MQRHRHAVLSETSGDKTSIIEEFTRERDKNMPSDDFFAKQDARRAKAAKKAAEAEKVYEWKGFVNVTITDKYRSTFETWERDDDLVIGAVLSAVEEVGKLSFSFDRRQGCFIAALTVTNTKRSDAGFCVTARSTDMFRAMRRVVFLYWQVAGGDLSKQAQATPAQYTDTLW